MRKSLEEWKIVFTRVFSSIHTFLSLNACSSITWAHSKVPTSSVPSSCVAAEEPAPISPDSDEVVGTERGKVVVAGLWFLVGSEDVVVVVPSPDMAPEPCRKPVGVLGDGRKGKVIYGVRDKGRGQWK